MDHTNLPFAAAIAAMPFAVAPVFGDSMPSYGNAFVTQGHIYPAGTLDDGVEGSMPPAVSPEAS